jgi:hypothetical protein
VADQKAAVTRTFDATATTPHLLGITPSAGAWRRGGIDGINCTTRDVTRHQTVAGRGSWHSTTPLTETMKRKAEIKVTATFVATVDLTDAKWQKLVGDYFLAEGHNWGADNPWAIETWAENEIAEGMCQLFLRRLPESIPMQHLAENSDGAEIVLINCIGAEYDGTELTNSL